MLASLRWQTLAYHIIFNLIEKITLQVVKKNNTSYKKAVQSDSDESGACDSELDELLDEALEEEGPTPPKINKVNEVTSFGLRLAIFGEIC